MKQSSPVPVRPVKAGTSGSSTGAGFGGGFHRRARPALLGRRRGRTRCRRTIETYDKLRRVHPGKHIVIAEFGWPSAGPNFDVHANPGRLEQAMVLRDFVARAEAYGIDYNVIESIDRPWKTMEGGVGPYWGLLDASRHAKFSWTGRSPIPTSQVRRSRGAARAVAVAADPGDQRRDAGAGRDARDLRLSSAPGSPPSSASGTATTLSLARLLR